MWKEIRSGDISMNSGNLTIDIELHIRIYAYWVGGLLCIHVFLYMQISPLSTSVEGPRNNDTRM